MTTVDVRQTHSKWRRVAGGPLSASLAGERLMRSIVEQISVFENAKREFREGVMRSVASLARLSSFATE